MKSNVLPPLNPGVVFRGQKIWISEFVSIIFVALLSFFLITLSYTIVSNEFTSRQLRVVLAKKQTDAFVLTTFRAQLSEKAAIAQLLCSIAGSKLPRHVILRLSEIVYDNSNHFGYDPLLLLAVMHVESVFELQALGRYRDGSESGAMGLMQLKIATAREVAQQLNMPELTREDLFRPEINIVLGTAYLTRMITKFKSFKLGILAYNQGPATIYKHLSQNKPLSVNYYNKVLAAYYTLKKKSAEHALDRNPKALCQ